MVCSDVLSSPNLGRPLDRMAKGGHVTGDF